MSKYKLNAELRTTRGKEKAKKLRAAGQFPAIVYGAGGEAESLVLDVRETETILNRIRGEKVLVDLQYGGKSDKVFVRNLQRDPVKNNLIHADFFRVDMKVEMETRIPVTHVGEAKGVKLGGLLEHVLRELTIRCLPGNVPPHVEVDVANLDIHESIHVSDLPEMEGVKIMTRPDSVLYAVVPKQAEDLSAAVATTEEEGEGAEEEAEEPAGASK